MNSLEKKINDLVVEGHCLNNPIVKTHHLTQNGFEKVIKEQIDFWEENNVKGEEQHEKLKNALVCRYKKVNHELDDYYNQVKVIENKINSANNDSIKKNKELQLQRSSLYTSHINRWEEHKMYLINYIRENKILNKYSPPKSKSVFRTMKSMFSSKKAGGKTKKGRKTRKTHKKK